jgi:hypothetical protein
MSYLSGKTMGPLSGQSTGVLGDPDGPTAFSYLAGSGDRRFGRSSENDNGLLEATIGREDQPKPSDRGNGTISPAVPRAGYGAPSADQTRLAGLLCQGFSSGCQNGGPYRGAANYTVSGRNLCRECAVKMLGYEDEPESEKIQILRLYPLFGRK